MSQWYSLLELRIKQKEVSNKNGVVGSTGKNMPIIPKVKDKKPKMINKYFLIDFTFTITASVREYHSLNDDVLS